MPPDNAILTDIVVAARRIAQFIRGVDRAAFLGDIEKQSAVLHQLLIVGEAARRLSPQFCTHHSAVPWRKIIAMRNLVIHNYDDVDLEIVWDTIEQDVPALLAYVEPMLPAMPTDAP